jgi:hypothetical protein
MHNNWGMDKNAKAKIAEDLALALIYLSARKEKGWDAELHRAWKGYEFSLLDRLKEEGLIDFSYTAKSLYLSREGVKRAEQLVKKFGSHYEPTAQP